MHQSTQISGGSWVNTATFGDCIYNFTVNTTVNNPFGADVMPNCNSTGAPPYFRPIIFWFLTNETTPPQGAASFCTPEISLFDVSVVVDMNDGSLTSVLEIQPFNASTLPLASLSQNVTGPPLNGEAFNGISFNLTNPDEYTVRRSNATTLQLSASILQVIAKTPGGVTTTFQTNNFTGTATMVYVSIEHHKFFEWMLKIYDLYHRVHTSKLRYKGKLPDHIQGKLRNPLIKAYQKWKGTEYVPPLTHPALWWSVKEPFPLLPAVTDAYIVQYCK